MCSYLAVIRDSFHSALASRVLWVAFVAIWLLLACLAPISYREDFTTTFRGQDFHNGTRMKAMLAQGLVDPKSESTAIGRLAAAMPDDLRRQLRRVGEGDEVRIRLNALAEALNKLLDDESWYASDAWASTLRLKELRELNELPADEMDDAVRRRRARLRIEAALPGVFQTRASRSILFTYAGLDFPAHLAVDKTQFTSLINQWVLPTIINWLLGFILIFLGILVTSSVVPDMLQPGSLHLLLSKPISRTLLLLSKFIGGCAFVLLCVTQLVIGLYLIAGLRLDIWNLRLLWCIPVSVFLFSVFYSVSTLAGLRWRSPILAIGVTTIFGAICLVVGVIGGLFDGLVTRPDQIQHLAVAGDQIFGSTRGGGLVRYDAEGNRWDEIFETDAMAGNRIIPPVALDPDTVVTARTHGGRFNPFGSGSLDAMMLTRSQDFVPEPSLRLPTATTWLYAAGDESVLALNTGDLSIAKQSALRKAAGEETTEGESAAVAETTSESPKSGWLSKLTSMMGGVTDGFSTVLPERMVITPPRGIVVAADGRSLIALSRGRLVRLQRSDETIGQWSILADRSLDGDASRRGVLAISDEVVLVSRTEESIALFDANTFETIGTVPLPESLQPVSALGMGGKRFVLLTGDGRFRTVAPNVDGEFETSTATGPSESEAIHWDRWSKRLYVAHHIDQIDVIDAKDMTTEKRIRPSLARWRLIDHFVVSPLRAVVPQTGELGETIAAMVSGKTAISIDDGEEEELVRYKIVRPVASCGIFILVMLSIGCIYFSTRDF